MDTIARIDALLKRNILPNTRADLVAFKAAAIAGTLDLDDERYVCHLYERLCSGADAQPSAPQRTAWRVAFERPSPIGRTESESVNVAPPAATEWLDGFFARLFILFGLTTRAAWRIAVGLCALAGVIAGIVGFTTTHSGLIDRVGMGVAYLLVAYITFGIALTVLRWLAIAAIAVVRVCLVVLHWLFTGREAVVSRVQIDFDGE